MSIVKDLLLIFVLIVCFFLYKKMKNEREYFINTLSHDLRVSTLAQIRGLELLEKNSLNNLDFELIKEINNSCKFTFEIINMLLNKYKYENNENFLKYEYFNLAELINLSYKKIFDLSFDKNITFVFDLDNCMISYADKDSIQKAISLLFEIAINNAINRSSITILSRERNNMQEISVVYQGKSLTDEEITRMFNNKSNYSTVGEGIRLEFCKKIMDFHKGKFFIKNLGGNLNSFTIALPIKNGNNLIENSCLRALQLC